MYHIQRLFLKWFLILFVLLSGASYAEESSLRISTLDLPIPAHTTNQDLLVYELHFFNTGTTPLIINRIEVNNAANQLLKTLTSTELHFNSMMYADGKRIEKNNLELAPNSGAFVFMWLTFKNKASIPANLKHKIWVVSTNADKSLAEYKVYDFNLAVKKEKPPVLALPLEGKDWIAEAAISPDSYHRRTILPVEGKFYLSQRYAIDWVQFSASGREVEGNMHENKNWHSFGHKIHAVDDGVITTLVDGVKENVPPGLPNPPPSYQDIAGNHVILKIHQNDKDYYVLYAHMQPNSIRVKLGDHVKKGQVIGLSGNTGNSSSPHFHMHVSNANDPLKADGVPFVFEKITQQGVAEEIDMDYGLWKSFKSSKSHVVQNILPAVNQVFDFGKAKTTTKNASVVNE